MVLIYSYHAVPRRMFVQTGKDPQRTVVPRLSYTELPDCMQSGSRPAQAAECRQLFLCEIPPSASKQRRGLSCKMLQSCCLGRGTRREFLGMHRGIKNKTSLVETSSRNAAHLSRGNQELLGKMQTFLGLEANDEGKPRMEKREIRKRWAKVSEVQ